MVPLCEGAHPTHSALGLCKGNCSTWGTASAPNSSRKPRGPPNMWSFLLQGGGQRFRDSASLSCGQAILVPWNALLSAHSLHLSRWCWATGALLAGWQKGFYGPHTHLVSGRHSRRNAEHVALGAPLQHCLTLPAPTKQKLPALTGTRARF